MSWLIKKIWWYVRPHIFQEVETKDLPLSKILQNTCDIYVAAVNKEKSY